METKCQARGRELMREIAEKGDKSRPKPALRTTHAGNGMGKKRKEDPVFSQRASPERSPTLTFTRSDVCGRCYASSLMVNKIRV